MDFLELTPLAKHVSITLQGPRSDERVVVKMQDARGQWLDMTHLFDEQTLQFMLNDAQDERDAAEAREDADERDAA